MLPALLTSVLWFAFFSTSLAVLPFDQWPHQRVALANTSIHLRYAGSGPPILLVHGVPEHSYTWQTIGPVLAQNYTVIALDDRGTGDSSLARDDDYTAETASEDLKGVLDFLNISQTYVVAHDKGVGLAAALSAKYRNLVKRASFIDYPLPGFGVYEASETPQPAWTAYLNWQLAFFSIPDVPEYFLMGREREYLTWYFWHMGYAGNSALSEDLLDIYTRAVQKPGFLRAAFKYFQAQWADASYFNATIRSQPLEMPLLAMGGEMSLSPISTLQAAYQDVATTVQYDLVPKAGHWIGEENPVWVANRLLRFLGEDDGIPSSDLSVLADQVTIPQQVAMGAILGRKSRRWQT